MKWVRVKANANDYSWNNGYNHHAHPLQPVYCFLNAEILQKKTAPIASST